MKNLDEWRNAVKQRDGNVCRRCRFDLNLHTHHIMPKGKYPELELVVDNGVTLCGNCHSLLKGQEEKVDLGDFLSPDAEIGKQLESLVKLIELIFEHARKIIMENTSKMAAGDKNPSLLAIPSPNYPGLI